MAADPPPRVLNVGAFCQVIDRAISRNHVPVTAESYLFADLGCDSLELLEIWGSFADVGIFDMPDAWDDIDYSVQQLYDLYIGQIASAGANDGERSL